MDGMFNHLHVVSNTVLSEQGCDCHPFNLYHHLFKNKNGVFKLPQAESCKASMTTPTHLLAPGDKQANTYTLILHHTFYNFNKSTAIQICKTQKPN